MVNIDEYYIAPISMLTKVEYIGNKQYWLTSKVFKYACVRRNSYDEYIDFLSNETYYSKARYYDDVGRVFINLNENGKLIPLNQLINKNKMSKRKIKKIIRIALIEFNKQFLSQKEADVIENINSEYKGKAKKLKCGSTVLKYTETHN